MRLLALFLFLISLVGCRFRQTTNLNQIIGSDDRQPTVSESVGLYWGVGPCTAFVVGKTSIMTARHCFTPKSKGVFRLGGKLFEITRVKEEFPNADLIVLDVNKSFLSQKILELISAPTTDKSYDMRLVGVKYDMRKGDYALLESKQQLQVSLQEGVLGHSMDSEKGSSGAPIFLDGKVFAIHLGALKGKLSPNYAVPYFNREKVKVVSGNQESAQVVLAAGAAACAASSECVGKVLEIVNKVVDYTGKYIVEQQQHDNEMEKMKLMNEINQCSAKVANGEGDQTAEFMSSSSSSEVVPFGRLSKQQVRSF